MAIFYVVKVKWSATSPQEVIISYTELVIFNVRLSNGVKYVANWKFSTLEKVMHWLLAVGQFAVKKMLASVRLGQIMLG